MRLSLFSSIWTIALSLVISCFLIVQPLQAAKESVHIIDTQKGSCECRDKNETKPECQAYCGDYDINGTLGAIINFTKLLLGFSGTAALVFFIYGGVLFLASGGNKDMITKGKTVIRNAVVGLFIIFLSYTAVSFFMNALGQKEWDTTQKTRQ